MTLLYFGEHLLLAENINIVTFSKSIVKEITLETIEKVKYLSHSTNTFNSIVNIDSLNSETYKDACLRASHKISIFLEIYKNNISELLNSSHLANDYTRVILTNKGKVDSPILSWINNRFNEKQREEIKEKGLEKKAYSAFNFIIASNDIIYDFLCLQYFKPSYEQVKISNILVSCQWRSGA